MTISPTFEVDPSSPVALYLQISEGFRRLIALGGLRPGDRLPTVRELAVRVRVNRNTAARAIQHLEREGLVRTRVGKGTFVDRSAPVINRAGRLQVVDDAIERLLVDARTVGLPLKELPGRLAGAIERLQPSSNEGTGKSRESDDE